METLQFCQCTYFSVLLITTVSFSHPLNFHVDHFLHTNTSKNLIMRSDVADRLSDAGLHGGSKNVPCETITIPLPLPQGAKPLEMVRIPAGAFMMGSPENEGARYMNEGPVHQVTLTQDFYMGKYEVTQAQWQAVMGNNPAQGYGVGDNYPVYYVSWMDGVRFCNRLSLQQGLTPVCNESNWSANFSVHGFRLPTEAEWEYACRAGTTTRFSHGDVLDNDDQCERNDVHD